MATVTIRDFSGSVNQSTNDNLLDVNQSPLAVNVTHDQVGLLASRLGTTMLGDKPSESGAVQGLANYIKDDGTHNPVLFVGGNLKKYTSGTNTWDAGSSSVVSASSTVECTNFINKLYFVGSGTTEYLKSWDGTNVATVAGNVPGKFVASSTGRMLCGGDDRKVYYSAVDSETFTLGSDYFYLDAPVTGLAPLGEGAPFLAFTEDDLFIIDVGRLTTQKLTGFGCSAHRSIQVIQGRAIWIGKDGIYLFTATDAYPTKISTPIENDLSNDAIFNQISSTGFTSGAAGTRHNKYYLSLGNLDTAIGGETLNDCWLVFDINQNTWSVRTYTANGAGAQFMSYKHPTNGYKLYAGSRDDGGVFEIDSEDVYTDAVSDGTTAAYTALYRTKHFAFEGAKKYSTLGREIAKRFKNAYFQMYGAGAVTISYSFDGATSYTSLTTTSATVAAHDWDYVMVAAPTNTNMKTCSMEFRSTSQFRVYEFGLDITAADDAELKAI